MNVPSCPVCGWESPGDERRHRPGCPATPTLAVEALNGNGAASTDPAPATPPTSLPENGQ